ncbi:MAG: MiaB/RimO family radical SAM methylthiotransferase [Lachnospiraceae bacterium]|nr:MiaB/RimO family radical SAM methylthiotransferase [Lachnospiraceae bacterium]
MPIVHKNNGKVKFEKTAGEKTAALHNLGCKVNAYETEALRELLEAEGYRIVPFTEAADVYVVNTCTVTNIADKKSRQMLRRARKLNPDAQIVAVGCYVDTAKSDLVESGICDIAIGNEDKNKLIGMLRSPAMHTRAFLKVQDGCEMFCAYCLIPYARGKSKSRDREEILEEVAGLARNGFQEFVLTGIHLSSYGKDTGDTLLSLVEAVDRIDGVKRIRLGSLEPRIITEAFCRGLSGIQSFCPHFHLSLQSGCISTLQRMNRHYTPEEYRASCELLRSFFTHPAITTDVITGFPGETEEEFAETVSFLKDLSLYEIHVFPYSRRSGTRAAKMEGQVPEETKKARSAVLLELTGRQAEAFREYYRGKEEEILLEECEVHDGIRYFTGYTKEYVKLAVAAEGREANTFARGIVGEELLYL